jgi:hypothetical protein
MPKKIGTFIYFLYYVEIGTFKFYTVINCNCFWVLLHYEVRIINSNMELYII